MTDTVPVPARPDARWSALIVREGVLTVDGRLVRVGATTWAAPLPLLDFTGQPAGTITRVWRVGDDLWAQGDQTAGFVPVDFDGRPNWHPLADLDASAFHTATQRPARRLWPWRSRTECPYYVITAARLIGAHMFPARPGRLARPPHPVRHLMPYRPRTPRTIWIRDRVLLILRASPDLTIGDIAAELGYRYDDGHTWSPAVVARWNETCGGVRCDRCQGHHPFPVYHALDSQYVLGVLVSMDRHAELIRWRTDTGAIWRWRLGPNAPTPTDTAHLELLLPDHDT